MFSLTQIQSKIQSKIQGSTLLNYPGRALGFRYGSTNTRQFYQQLCRYIRYPTYQDRANLGKQMAKHLPQETRSKLEKYGSLVFTPNHLDIITDVTEIGRRMVAEKLCLGPNLQTNSGLKKGKDYLLSLELELDAELDLESPFLKLALHPLLLAYAAQNIGMLPILTNLQLWHSPNVNIENDGSQLFHLDHADVRQMKVFVFIDDVTINSGPLTLLGAASSAKVCSAINYKLSSDQIRVRDDTIHQIVGKDDIHPLIGPSGTMAFVDTCRCFHFGSRYGKTPRTVLMIQYLSPFAFYLPWNWKMRTKFSYLATPNTSSLIQKVLGAQ